MIHYAIDLGNHRVYIDSATNDTLYYCENCGARLIPKKGESRAHHYAHRFDMDPTPRQLACREYCERQESNHEMSEWHQSWQNEFPEICRERYFTNENNEIHRADVFIERSKTIVEFQHSPLKASEFHKRNQFYNSLGYDVVWMYDIDSVVGSHLKYIHRNRATDYEKQMLALPFYNQLYHMDVQSYTSLFGTWLPQIEKQKPQELGRVTIYFMHCQSSHTFIQQLQMVPDNNRGEKALFVTDSDKQRFLSSLQTQQEHKVITPKSNSGSKQWHIAYDGSRILEGKEYRYTARIDIDGGNADSISSSIKNRLGTDEGSWVHMPNAVTIYHVIDPEDDAEYTIEFSSYNEMNNASLEDTKKIIDDVIRKHVYRLLKSEIYIF